MSDSLWCHGLQHTRSPCPLLETNIYFCFINYKPFDCVDHSKLWKILKDVEIPEQLTCLLRNLYTGLEATVRTLHGTTDWFQIGKGVHEGSILSPYLFSLYAECIMRNYGLDESQAGIKIAERNINNFRCADDFCSSHVWMWELDCKEGWVLKNWYFWTVEKTLESPLDCKENKPVNL